MIGYFTLSPAYEEEIVTLSIYANTNGNTLGYWWPKIEFNTNYLQFDSANVGELWEELVFLLEKNEVNEIGILESYSANMKREVESIDTIGNSIYLGDYHFKVKHDNDFKGGNRINENACFSLVYAYSTVRGWERSIFLGFKRLQKVICTCFSTFGTSKRAPKDPDDHKILFPSSSKPNPLPASSKSNLLSSSSKSKLL